jgi:protein phosphatase
VSRFKLDVGTATDMGRLRDWNEDYFATYVPRSERASAMRGLLLVAEGVGGERDGAGDRRLAVERVLEQIAAEAHSFRSQDATDPDATDPEVADPEVAEVVRRVIREASGPVFDAGSSEPPAQGPSFALAMVAFRTEEALVAQVGESRCYRVRAGGIECLTCARDPGNAGVPGVEVRTEPLADRDLFILCSDGLSNALSDDEILEVSKRFVRPQDLAEALVALAIGNDGSDNATAVVCRCRDAVRLEALPEDTEPIFVPRAPREAVPSFRSRWLIAALAVLLAAAAFAAPRWMAERAFDRGKEHAFAGEYLHARRDFSTAIRLGLGKERTDELIDILLRFPSSRVAAPAFAETADAGEEPAAEPEASGHASGGGG